METRGMSGSQNIPAERRSPDTGRRFLLRITAQPVTETRDGLVSDTRLNLTRYRKYLQICDTKQISLWSPRAQEPAANQPKCCMFVFSCRGGFISQRKEGKINPPIKNLQSPPWWREIRHVCSENPTRQVLITAITHAHPTVLLPTPRNLIHRDNNSPLWAKGQELLHVQHAHKHRDKIVAAGRGLHVWFLTERRQITSFNQSGAV